MLSWSSGLKKRSAGVESPRGIALRFFSLGYLRPYRLSARFCWATTPDDGKLIYAGRVGTGMPDKTLADLRRRLEPLARSTMPLTAPPSACAIVLLTTLSP